MVNRGDERALDDPRPPFGGYPKGACCYISNAPNDMGEVGCYYTHESSCWMCPTCYASFWHEGKQCSEVNCGGACIVQNGHGPGYCSCNHTGVGEVCEGHYWGPGTICEGIQGDFDDDGTWDEGCPDPDEECDELDAGPGRFPWTGDVQCLGDCLEDQSTIKNSDEHNCLMQLFLEMEEIKKNCDEWPPESCLVQIAGECNEALCQLAKDHCDCLKQSAETFCANKTTCYEAYDNRNGTDGHYEVNIDCMNGVDEAFGIPSCENPNTHDDVPGLPRVPCAECNGISEQRSSGGPSVISTGDDSQPPRKTGGKTRIKRKMSPPTKKRDRIEKDQAFWEGFGKKK